MMCLFQDTNEVEVENSDKKNDFNLKVSNEWEILIVAMRRLFFALCKLLEVQKLLQNKFSIRNIIFFVFINNDLVEKILLGHLDTHWNSATKKRRGKNTKTDKLINVVTYLRIIYYVSLLIANELIAQVIASRGDNIIAVANPALMECSHPIKEEPADEKPTLWYCYLAFTAAIKVTNDARARTTYRKSLSLSFTYTIRT